MVRWEREELAQSTARGAWDRWGVQDAEQADEWMLFAFEQRRIYAPLEHPELSSQFARVGTDDPALMTFVQHYGRLGWHELVEEDRARWRKHDPWFRRATNAKALLLREAIAADRGNAIYAEPVDWIRAHAHTVAWCLEAGHTLQTPNSGGKRKASRQLLGRLPTQVGCRGTLRDWLLPEKLVTTASPEDVVGWTLQDFLWINLKGVRRRVQYTGGTLRTMWGGQSLLESIYTLVADAATGGRIAHCHAPDCGAAFIQTDQRQRFCPPREGQAKSTCMNRQRRRRQLRKLQEERHGKTTRSR